MMHGQTEIKNYICSESDCAHSGIPEDYMFFT